MLLISGSSHPVLANEIAHELNISLAKTDLNHFPDGEISLQIKENVRGRDVFVVQTIALDPNNYLMELLIIIDALKRASAQTITPIIPYYGYGRQDRKDKPRVPITAKLVADLLVSAGATHIVSMDLHAGQIQGFFDIPVDMIHGMPPLVKAFQEAVKVKENQVVVVAPDIGSVKMARSYATALNCDFAVIDKQRTSSTEVVATVIGDVKGKDVLLADDMCSTGGTLVSAAKACREKGAERIFAAATHGLLIGDCVEKIEKSLIEALFITNTIPYTERLARSTKIRTVSVGIPFSQAIRCLVTQGSLAQL